MWDYVIPHFNGFLHNIEPTKSQHDVLMARATEIGKKLYARYYEGEFDSRTLLIAGSYAKGTAIKASDLDIMFLLPIDDFHRISDNQSNGQSQLLQEFKAVVENRYSATEHKADGQVVVSEFRDAIIEIVPATQMNDGSFIICDSNDGGGWRASHPLAEIQRLNTINSAKAGRVTHLIKMMKCAIVAGILPIKSISLEIAACDFIAQWECDHHIQPAFWYDWMVRDFLAFLLINQGKSVKIPGSGHIVPIGDQGWVKSCEKAYQTALNACHYEQQNMFFSAEEEWRELFGAKNFPRYIINQNLGLPNAARSAFIQSLVSS